MIIVNVISKVKKCNYSPKTHPISAINLFTIKYSPHFLIFYRLSLLGCFEFSSYLSVSQYKRTDRKFIAFRLLFFPLCSFHTRFDTCTHTKQMLRIYIHSKQALLLSIQRFVSSRKVTCAYDIFKETFRLRIFYIVKMYV